MYGVSEKPLYICNKKLTNLVYGRDKQQTIARGHPIF